MSPRAPRHNVKPFGKRQKKEIQQSADWLEVFPLSIWSDLLISLLFWRISIRYRAFVEGSMCPPKHFPNTRVSAPSLPPFSSLVCQITFPTQPQYPHQQPPLWACTIGEGMVSVVHVVPVWLGGKTRRAGRKSYGSTRKAKEALINYVVHLHIPVVRHYVNTGWFA